MWKLQIELLSLSWCYMKTITLAVRSNLRCLEIEWASQLLLEIKLRRFDVFLRLLLWLWRSSRAGRGRGFTNKGPGEQDRPKGGSQGQAQPWGGWTGLQWWAWVQGQAGTSAHGAVWERSGNVPKGKGTAHGCSELTLSPRSQIFRRRDALRAPRVKPETCHVLGSLLIGRVAVCAHNWI